MDLSFGFVKQLSGKTIITQILDFFTRFISYLCHER